MKEAFIIMQIGNSELDKVCRDSIIPALKSVGLNPRRVDKHNSGGLLKSEIIKFIESAEIIVADLTNERPNCYLEVGYAMGMNKFQNLILTARDNHNQDNPKHVIGGPKIHFDLRGYDILFWDIDNLKEFQEELRKRIVRRLTALRLSPSSPASSWDTGWISAHQRAAFEGLKKSGQSCFMEIKMRPLGSQLNLKQAQLLETADKAQVHNFGWPIGVVLNRDEYRPRPKSDGIVAEINAGDSYDYWTIHYDGSFYLLKSLFEDRRQQNTIFFDTRIVRITEALMYARNLYSGLGVSKSEPILIGIRHGNLKGRILTSADPGRLIHESYTSLENEVYTEINTNIEELTVNLFDLVEKFIKPLFVIFDYFEISRKVLEDIITRFINRK